MDKTHFERLFSTGRLARFYQAARQDTTEASALYAANIQLSESLYPCLAVAEVALRNALHRQLSYLCRSPDWYRLLPAYDRVLADLQPELDKAQKYIRARRETLSTDKIVAELTFGFWSSLFNRAYELVLWKQLRLAFPHLPKPDRQRATVSATINAVRQLRNRVYHHEPVAWRLPQLRQQYEQVCTLLGWLDPQLLTWLQPIDRFPAVWQAEYERRERGATP
ncbi:MAG: Abi family protein [Janthinobacterium lividum]